MLLVTGLEGLFYKKPQPGVRKRMSNSDLLALAVSVAASPPHPAPDSIFRRLLLPASEALHRRTRTGLICFCLWACSHAAEISRGWVLLEAAAPYTPATLPGPSRKGAPNVLLGSRTRWVAKLLCELTHIASSLQASVSSHVKDTIYLVKLLAL